MTEKQTDEEVLKICPRINPTLQGRFFDKADAASRKGSVAIERCPYVNPTCSYIERTLPCKSEEFCRFLYEENLINWRFPFG